ncbi:glycosyltransferase [Jiella sp. CBK1P-4]|uniref:Glycosyltransferase n=1 Tax=Jiella avicenniae TaxID=2907202 RepID=A0A9X1NZ70_9HYPH|nr:glycosyltransferase [Jiella avicenniae]MCE7027395.1 glycosyltransferase [Jiella avicenniae]
MRRLVFAIPGDLSTPSGGYGYDRRLIGELRRLGWEVEHLRLPDGFPRPSRAERADAEAAFAALTDGDLVLVDGLAFGAMPDIADRHASRLRLAALVHHPLFLETGLDRSTREALDASERHALLAARAVVVTSPATAETVSASFAVPAERLTVALPGTDKPSPPLPAGGRGEAPPTILSIGTLIPRKDHATLVAALAGIADLAWRCRIVGSMSADPDTAEALRRQIETLGLSGRIELVGAMADVAAEYPKADLFVLASRYEGYGMVFAEALAHGLPVVFCAAGAPQDFIPEAAGRRFEPGDAEGLAAALRALLVDGNARAGAAEAAYAAGRALPGWDETARIVAAALSRLDDRR